MAAKRADVAPTLLFVPGNGWFYKLNPMTKLILLAWTISLSIVLPPVAASVLVVAGVLFAYAVGVGPSVATKLFATLIPLGIALGVVHGFLIVRSDEVALAGPLHVSHDGFAYAYSIVARIGGVLMGSLIFVTTTHPGDMLKSLDARGVSPAIGYLIASPLLLLEPFSQRARGIRDAQKARGMDLTGSWRAKIVALPALLVPLITLALSDLDHRVMVLENRAFRGEKRRTVLDAPADSTGQSWFRRVVAVLAVLQLGLINRWH